MLNFCTLFNSGYLTRGLAMYRSLEDRCADFHLYIFAFDDTCFNTLQRLHLAHATIIPLADFEDSSLLEVKKTRTFAEYCWTCTPLVIRYCLDNYPLDHCTYVDADLLFFKDPRVLVEEMGNKSVLITEHRYLPEYDVTAIYGKYCVQFMTFKRDLPGLTALKWWCEACLAWCFNRLEDNKFGDQKYLDNWMEMFDGVHELQHLGGGVAPWNVKKYQFSAFNGQVTGTEMLSGKTFDLVFYHFSSFKYITSSLFSIPSLSYEAGKSAALLIHSPYVKYLTDAENDIKKLDKKIKTHELAQLRGGRLRTLKRQALAYFLGNYKEFYHKGFLLAYGQIN